jgi:D-arabinose 1-dehydrogenase-like Zn-dependent alcohol dehydrogenase
MRSYRVERVGEALTEMRDDLPVPQGTEVLLRVDACGVCHSDVHLTDGYFDLGDGKRLATDRMMSPPRTLGHEIAATVVAVGPDTDRVDPGERFVIYPWLGCEACAVCSAGDEHLCARPRAIGVQRDGGFSEYVLVPHPRVLVPYDPLSDEQACSYACAGITAFSALKKAVASWSGGSLLIIGAGGVGLWGIRLARHLHGIAPVVAEIDHGKWQSAYDAGAAAVIDSSAADAARDLVKSTDGGVSAAIDFVGAASTFTFGMNTLRKGGRLVCVGLFGGVASISPTAVAMKTLSVMGSYVGSLKDLRELLEIGQSGILGDLPISVRPLADADRVLSELRTGAVRGRVVLRG